MQLQVLALTVPLVLFISEQVTPSTQLLVYQV
jgi:hypothetical protein